MGRTITNTNRRALGNEFEVNCDAVFNAVYTTGGVAIIPEDLGLLSILRLSALSKSGYVFEWVSSTAKLKVYRSGATTPAGTNSAPAFTGTPASPGTPAGTVDPGTHVFTGAAMGNFTPAGSVAAPAFTGAAGAQAALAEVTNGVDLSTTPGSFIIIARGR